MSRTPGVIAHRGAADRYPENTLAALRAAIEGGVTSVEFDIQISADREALVVHDVNLLRTAGVDRIVTAACASELTAIPVPERSRLGDRHGSETIPTLRQALDLIAATPGTRGFVEIKRESLEAFGHRRVLDALVPPLQRSAATTVLISFDRRVLEMARERGIVAIGWVLDTYDEHTREIAEVLRPEYLFCNHLRLPTAGPLWTGCWRWAVYEVTSATHARSLARRGVHEVESMAAIRLQDELRAAGEH